MIIKICFSMMLMVSFCFGTVKAQQTIRPGDAINLQFNTIQEYDQHIMAISFQITYLLNEAYREDKPRYQDLIFHETDLLRRDIEILADRRQKEIDRLERRGLIEMFSPMPRLDVLQSRDTQSIEGTETLRDGNRREISNRRIPTYDELLESVRHK